MQTGIHTLSGIEPTISVIMQQESFRTIDRDTTVIDNFSFSSKQFHSLLHLYLSSQVLSFFGTRQQSRASYIQFTFDLSQPLSSIYLCLLPLIEIRTTVASG
jgi:hypothetical protein